MMFLRGFPARQVTQTRSQSVSEGVRQVGRHPVSQAWVRRDEWSVSPQPELGVEAKQKREGGGNRANGCGREEKEWGRLGLSRDQALAVTAGARRGRIVLNDRPHSVALLFYVYLVQHDICHKGLLYWIHVEWERNGVRSFVTTEHM